MPSSTKMRERPPPLLHNIRNPVELVLDVLQTRNLGLGFFEVEAAGVVGVEFLDGGALGVAVLEEFVVVEVAVVGRDGVEVAHVDGLGGFFLGEEGLVHLLAVADADDFDVFFLASEEFANSFCLRLDGAGGGFLDQNITVLAVLEGEEDEVHGFFEAHDEAGHLGLGEGDGVALSDLVDPEGDDAAAGAHDVAVAGAADLGVAGKAALGHGDLLLDGLGDAHGVDGIGGLVGGEADDALDSGLDGGVQGVVGADYVGLDGLHREEFAARDLLEGGGVEDVVDALHGVFEGALIADVTNIELDLVRHFRHAGLEVVAHVVLLLFIAGEDADFADVGTEETVQDGVAETAGASGDEEDFVFE